MGSNSFGVHKLSMISIISISMIVTTTVETMTIQKSTITRPRGQRCVLKPLFHFSFFLQLFHFFALIVALLSSSLLPAHSSCPSFLLVPPPSSSLFLTRPAPSESFRIRKRPFFIDFDKSVTSRRTNRKTDQPTGGQSLLKRCEDASKIIEIIEFTKRIKG